MVTGSSDRTIKLWDYAKGFCNKTFNCSSSCFTIDVMTSESLIVSGHLDGSLRFWSGRQEHKVTEMTDLHSDAITSVNIMPNGKQIVTTSRDHSVKLIDMATYRVLSTFEHEDYLNGSNTSRAAIASNGKYGVLGSKNGAVIIFEQDKYELTLEEVYSENHGGSVNGVAWSKEGVMASIDSDGLLLIWE